MKQDELNAIKSAIEKIWKLSNYIMGTAIEANDVNSPIWDVQTELDNLYFRLADSVIAKLD